jgi:hypothetical protein
MKYVDENWRFGGKERKKERGGSVAISVRKWEYGVLGVGV